LNETKGGAARFRLLGCGGINVPCPFVAVLTRGGAAIILLSYPHRVSCPSDSHPLQIQQGYYREGSASDPLDLFWMVLPIIVILIVIVIRVIIVLIPILFFMMGVMRRMMVVMVVWLALGLFGVVRAEISVVGKAFPSDKSHCNKTQCYSPYDSHVVFPKLTDVALFA
jgi:hypothetical protein